MATGKAFFLLRLNDHIQYLKKVDATLAGTSDFEGTDCHDCKLGKWLYGVGVQEVSSMKNTKAQTIFNEIFEPHQRFHEISKLAIERKRVGDDSGAKALVTEMHVLSRIISQKLLELDGLD